MLKPLKPIIERSAISDAKIHENLIINRVLLNRGIGSMDQLEYSLAQLINPFEMANMQGAVELLTKHLERNSRMVVVGDFDCDGATSTSIAVAGLKMMGATNVSFIIPDRVIHGYGLTPSIVQLAAEMEPDIIITVDNGIASFDGAEAVKALSRPCDLLVTDHHLASDKGLPCADQIVNPNQPGCPFPSKNLAGCGVMFYVILALRSHLRNNGYFDRRLLKEPNVGVLLDLVALGTVADVVPLDKNNRILIDAGLNRIRAGYARPGITALLEVSKRDASKITASDMGFSLGPRINAAGRLDDMTVGIQCLLSENFQEAMEIAERLDDLNQQRREIESDHVIDAALLIQEHDLDKHKGVILYDNTWHPGVVGIVASRIKDRLNRPVICMTDADDAKKKREEINEAIQRGAPQQEIDRLRNELLDCEVKGSARSIEGIHLKHALDHICKQHPDVLTKFGGHAMAAGLSLKYKNLERFKALFDEEVAKEITPEQMVGSITVDIKNVDGNYLNLDLAKQIRSLGPWGQLFPEPNFHAKFHVLKEPLIMKEKHAKFTVAIEGCQEVFEAVAFGVVQDGVLPVGDEFDGAFTLDINEYKGKQRLQLMLRDLQPGDPGYESVKNIAKAASEKPIASVDHVPAAAQEKSEPARAETTEQEPQGRPQSAHIGGLETLTKPSRSTRDTSDFDQALAAILASKRRKPARPTNEPENGLS